MPQCPPDISKADWSIYSRVHPFTMTGADRVLALISSVRHIARAKIAGDIVECGVWRGGSMLAVAMTLIEEADSARDLYLFDTFAGMTQPTEMDVDLTGSSAAELLMSRKKSTEDLVWAYAPLSEVQGRLRTSEYPDHRLRFVQGDVLDTIPSEAPQRIALLRLDTDWYESTYHELEQLFPRLSPGGILIIDDYGHWAGARQAVDEYLAKNSVPIYLHRIDYTGRLAIKPN